MDILDIQIGLIRLPLLLLDSPCLILIKTPSPCLDAKIKYGIRLILGLNFYPMFGKLNWIGLRVRLGLRCCNLKVTVVVEKQTIIVKQKLVIYSKSKF